MIRCRVKAAWTLFFFVAGLLPTGFAGAHPNPGDEEPYGMLDLICQVSGAQFVIDEGQASAMEGITPTDPIMLSVGPHTIRVSREGYLPFSEVFDIEEDGNTELEVDLVLYSGRLRVSAVPPPVEVQVDGQVLGVVPVETDLSIGEHVVRLSKDGYVEEIRRVAVRTGRTTDLSVTLLPVAEVQKAAGGGPIHKKWWFWTVLAAVAAGVIVPSVLLTRKGSEPASNDAVLELP